jgi:maleate isomerase
LERPERRRLVPLELSSKKLDAIVLLGTGMPTLPAIARHPRAGEAVVLSCMLCLGWAAIDAATHQPPQREALVRFVEGDEWKARLFAQLGAIS